MTRESTEIPPAGGPAEPAPETAREAAHLGTEGAAAPEVNPMSSSTEQQPEPEHALSVSAEVAALPVPVEPEPASTLASPAASGPADAELVAPTTTASGEPAEI